MPGGRFDHGTAIVSTLYENPELPVILVTSYNLIWLLDTGEHTDHSR